MGRRPRPGRQLPRGAMFWAAALALALLPALVGQGYLLRVAGMVMWLFLLALGLDVVAGLAGLLDLGFTAFVAVGAYVYAFLASGHFGLHLGLLPALAAGVAAGGLAGAVVGLPSLRVDDDYLAIVTLAFAQVVRILLVNLDRPLNITNGPNGITRLDPPAIGPFVLSSPVAGYLLLVAGAAAGLALVRGLDSSRLGRALRAIRDDRVVAGCLGFPARWLKLTAFLIGAAVMGGAGVLFAAWQGSVFPENFDTTLLITVYCVLVLGGSRHPAGMLAAAAGLVWLPELLRGSAIYRMLIYGLVLVGAVVLRQARQEKAEAGARAASVARVARGARDTGEGLAGGEAPGVAAARGRLALVVSGVSVRFGALEALREVSLTVGPGEIVGLIGPNGAGKTTLFNVLSGLVRPAAGRAELVLGPPAAPLALGSLPVHARSRAGLARTFQGGGLFGSMSLAENLACAMQAAGRRAWGPAARDERGAAAWASGLVPALAPRLGERPAALTYGQRRVGELLRAIASDPAVLLLDEPMAGLGLDQVAEVEALVRRQREQGRAVLLVEHRMETVFGLCDRVVVLDRGEVICQGVPREVAADPGVRRAYLGDGQEAAAPAASGRPGGEGFQPLPGRKVQPILSVRGLVAGYGESEVLHGVDLEVLPGEVVCLLGPNAAGKTTLLWAILGAARARRGNIAFLGRDLDGLPGAARVALGLALVPEGRRLFPGLTVEEHLVLGAMAAGAGGRARGAAAAGVEAGDRRSGPRRGLLAERISAVLELFPHLRSRLGQPAGTLSGGEQQMVAVGRALASAPRLILLDEPCMGLAPALAARLLSTVSGLPSSAGPFGGCAVLMVEQNASLALAASARAYAMRDGRIVLSGPASELRAGEALRRAYLSV